MQPPRHHPPLSLLRRGVIWVLLWALAGYGLTGALQEFAATRHTHRVLDNSFQLMVGWVDFRRVGHSAPVKSDAHDHASGSHGQGVFETHQHSMSDPTVVSLDGLDEAVGDASSVLSSAGGHAGALITGSIRAPQNGDSATWQGPLPQRFLSAEVRLLERPPRG